MFISDAHIIPEEYIIRYKNSKEYISLLSNNPSVYIREMSTPSIELAEHLGDKIKYLDAPSCYVYSIESGKIKSHAISAKSLEFNSKDEVVDFLLNSFYTVYFFSLSNQDNKFILRCYIQSSKSRIRNSKIERIVTKL